MYLILMLVIFGLMPIYSFIRMVMSFLKRGKQMKFKLFDSIFSISVYCVVVVALSIDGSGEIAGKPLKMFEQTGSFMNGYASLAIEYIPSIFILLTLGLFSFKCITLFYDWLSPIVYVFCSTLVITNIFLGIMYLTHTVTVNNGLNLAVYLLQIGFGSLCFLYIARLKNSLDQFYEHEEMDIKYKNIFLQFFANITNNYNRMSKVWIVSLFPIMVIIHLILILFGQRPDSFIRVFLDTSSFNYSNIPPPDPEMISGDGHYLCTVSALGHPNIVKPVRAGIRRGRCKSSIVSCERI
ncbi:DUF6688 family protein [Alkalihalobacillus sp. LMS39]|uniref:DUF6688 domain-containing protein n=1 Tax=Alkalihalobacillus sp. LMS39 TaxID=2924032 RepID=UPI001FB40C68|nr:DUF6688 family protein [Alkalihalobacillus sp. LMS39]UOE94812.1 hypothetical protein MM271_03965 [Alkalihalobacillus sp. LMS39]